MNNNSILPSEITLSSFAKQVGLEIEDILQYGIDGALNIHIVVNGDDLCAFYNDSTKTQKIKAIDDIRSFLLDLIKRSTKRKLGKNSIDNFARQLNANKNIINLFNVKWRDGHAIWLEPTLHEQYFGVSTYINAGDDITWNDLIVVADEAELFKKKYCLSYRKLADLCVILKRNKFEILNLAYKNNLKIWAKVNLTNANNEKVALREFAFIGLTHDGEVVSIPYTASNKKKEIDATRLEQDEFFRGNGIIEGTAIYVNNQVSSSGYEMLTKNTIKELHNNNCEAMISEYELEDRDQGNRKYVNRYLGKTDQIKKDDSFTNIYQEVLQSITIDDLYIREDEIIKYKDLLNRVIKKNKKSTPAQEDKKECRKRASVAWENDPSRTIQSIIDKELEPYKKLYFGAHTLRNWIKDLDPRPKSGSEKRGRPRKNS